MVFDQVLTDTALYADVVLPATTFLEHYEFVKGYGPISLQLARPVIEQVGESRPNPEVFADLIRRLGLDARRRSRRRTRRDAADSRSAAGPARRRTARPVGRRRRRSRAGRCSSSTSAADVGSARSTCFRRTSIARRRSDCMDFSRTRRPTTTRWRLISPASERTISSTLGELPRPDVRLDMHPDDAEIAASRTARSCGCSTSWERCALRRE